MRKHSIPTPRQIHQADRLLHLSENDIMIIDVGTGTPLSGVNPVYRDRYPNLALLFATGLSRLYRALGTEEFLDRNGEDAADRILSEAETVLSLIIRIDDGEKDLPILEALDSPLTSPIACWYSGAGGRRDGDGYNGYLARILEKKIREAAR